MQWFERPEVLDYLVRSYAGLDKGKRQFIWEDENGDVVIGNTRAFTDHLSRQFQIPLTSTSWSKVHEALRELGEVAREYTPRSNSLGKHFVNQEPIVRVIRKKENR